MTETIIPYCGMNKLEVKLPNGVRFTFFVPSSMNTVSKAKNWLCGPTQSYI